MPTVSLYLNIVNLSVVICSATKDAYLLRLVKILLRVSRLVHDSSRHVQNHRRHQDSVRLEEVIKAFFRITTICHDSVTTLLRRKIDEDTLKLWDNCFGLNKTLLRLKTQFRAIQACLNSVKIHED